MLRFDKITELYKSAAIYGKLAVVYHGSRMAPEEFIKLWQEARFKPGSGAGQARGPGLYTVYNKDENSTSKGFYGNYIYKFVVNLDNFLILVNEEIDKVYPELSDLKYKEKVLRQFKKFDITSDEAIRWLNKVRGEPNITSGLATIIKDAGLHYGIVYRGEGDGDCCLIQIPENAKLAAYEDVGGFDKKEVRFNKEEIKKINLNYKVLSNRTRSPKQKLVEYMRVYPEKALSIIGDKAEDLLDKNKNANLSFYQNIAREAAESHLAQRRYLWTDSFFTLKLHNLFPELGKDSAKSFAERNPMHFIELNLAKTYPEFVVDYATDLANTGNHYFFKYNLHEVYPHLMEDAAKKLFENSSNRFFEEGVQNIYPDLGRAKAKEIAAGAVDNRNYFYKHGLQKAYPEIGRSILEAGSLDYQPHLFFDYNLGEDYPNLEYSFAEKTLKQDVERFIKLELYMDFPEFKKEAIERYAVVNPQDFIRREFYKDYPELGNLAAQNYIRTNGSQAFFNQEYQELFPEAGKEAAKKLLVTRPKLFMKKDLYKNYTDEVRSLILDFVKARPKYYFDSELKDYYPEYKKVAVDSAARLDPTIIFDSSYEDIRKEDYPEQAEVAARVIADNHSDDFFKLSLNDDYPEMGESAAENVAKNDPFLFFNKTLKIFDLYPKFERFSALNAAQIDLKRFFAFELHKKFPQIGRSAIIDITNSFINTDLPERQDYYEKHRLEYIKMKNIDFSQFFIKKNLYKIYPEVGKDLLEGFARIAKPKDLRLFYTSDAHRDYPDIGEAYIEEYIGNNLYNLFVNSDLYKHYPKFAKTKIIKFAKDQPLEFFYWELHKSYPELIDSTAEKVVNINPGSFFGYELQGLVTDNKRLGESAAKNLSELDALTFFEFDLQNDYPQFEKAAYKNAVANNNRYFVFELAKAEYSAAGGIKESIKKMLELYPEISDIAIQFFLEDKSPPRFGLSEVVNLINAVKDKNLLKELVVKVLNQGKGRSIIAKWDLEEFFYSALSAMSAENFFKLIMLNDELDDELYDIINYMPDHIKGSLYKNLINSNKDLLFLFYKRLQKKGMLELNFFPDEFTNMIPEIAAEIDPEYFQDNIYNLNKEEVDLDTSSERAEKIKELKDLALKNLSENNFSRWLKDIGIKEVFINSANKIAESNLEELLDKYLDTKYFDNLKAPINDFIDNNFIQILLALSGSDEAEFKKSYYNHPKIYADGRTGSPHVFSKDELISRVLEENGVIDDEGGIIRGLVSGIFVWFANDKFDPIERDMGEESIKDEILNDPANSEEFFKFYKQAYHYAVSLSDIDTDMSRAQTEYMYESEGIDSDEESFFNEEYFGGYMEDLFDKPKTQEELEREENEDYYQYYKDREMEDELEDEYELEKDLEEDFESEEIEKSSTNHKVVLLKLSTLRAYLDGLGQKEAAKELSELIEKEAAKKKKKKKKKKSKKKKDRTPTKPDLWQRAIAAAKRKFDVYPSAYANGWALQWYKKKGGGWRGKKPIK